MSEAFLRLRVSVAVASSATTIEVALIAVAVALLVALLLAKAKRERDQKVRKAASQGYYDPDAARYGQGSVAPPPGEAPTDPTHLPLAPSFVAPGRDAKRREPARVPPSPRPVPSSLRTLTAEPPQSVPVFDPAEAISTRPAGGTGTLPPPPPPPMRPLSNPPPPAPSLPRLDLPPPPA